MNYLRGAVNAISAPYQYYKDINPSTLTGAIDVIVISRPKLLHDHDSNDPQPAPDGDKELACSPFHVRFGKWQVLRPTDKKVNVFVNGKLIPFSMKIGDAGEAFFVFETDEDIPEEIVTSPILEATKPGEARGREQPTGRFGAKDRESSSTPPNEDAAADSQEPDFLDLNAEAKDMSSLPSSASAASDNTMPDVSMNGHDDDEPKASTGPSSLISRTAELGKAALGLAHEAEKAEKDKLKDKSVKDAIKEVQTERREYIRDGLNAAKSFSPTKYLGAGSQKGDEVLPDVSDEDTSAPEVHYGHDMVFDTEGYHSHGHTKEQSDETVRESGDNTPPDSTSEESTPGPSRSSSPSVGPIPFPRATSEPPPDMLDDSPSGTKSLMASPRFNTQARPKRIMTASVNASSLKLTMPDTETEEYSWEWGNFPQKTPVWTAFHYTDGENNLKGKARMSPDAMDGPSDYMEYDPSTAESSKNGYGSGGSLTVDRTDRSRFRVFIEGRAAEFELSIVPTLHESSDDTRTRTHSGSLGGRDVVEDAELFAKGKVDFDTFLQDERIVKSNDLVLCWANDRYITRRDGSPLMDALELWRQAALKGGPQVSSRPVSPMEDEDRRLRTTSMDTEDNLTSMEQQANGQADQTAKPTSSSWVRWWSRSRRADTIRPELRPASSEPPDVERLNAAGKIHSEQGVPMLSRPDPVQAASTESAPALLPSPELHASQSSLPVSESDGEKSKRFAKTLRLTSDQLKSLDLKPGANTITFSLSATGAAACTARIFVWEHTDSIVVSDIDGTITKSDALGHVFTMIGRDWTHLGVAKLYTDICRNGYKIMYLTSRAIGQADSTRDYLRGIKQNDYQLPEGPVIMSPDRLMASLHREVIMRKPEVFKMACLRDIQRLFGPMARNPFYAGFGNRITDALSYRSVNVPSSRIFTIDSSSEVKMELLELAGYKSSYIHMTDLVDQMFPPINRRWQAEYTDFNYWKTPIMDIPLPDLSPPSPALSARSDTSNQSTLARLRNFSLGGRQASNSSHRFSLPPPAIDESVPQEEVRREAHLRQMSSFERLSSTLSNLAVRSSSSTGSSPGTLTPTSGDSDSEDDTDADELEKGHRHRRRRRSISSMPGSLPGSTSDDEFQFGVEEEEDVEEGEYYEGEHEEVATDDVFDENLFAAGEMEHVPFL